MKDKKIDIENLMTIKNYASKEGVTASYIYKLIKQARMESYSIDGIQFIEVNRFPFLPVANRR